MFRSARKENVQSNCYTIRFDKPVTLLHYEVKFYVENERGRKDLSQGMKTE